MKTERVKIEFHPYEFEALKSNRMIWDMCSHYLKSAKKRGDVVVLEISTYQANDLAGWVAAEGNHAKSKKERDLLYEVCDVIEARI